MGLTKDILENTGRVLVAKRPGVPFVPKLSGPPPQQGEICVNIAKNFSSQQVLNMGA